MTHTKSLEETAKSGMKIVLCPVCEAPNFENSRFCCMCGVRFDEAEERADLAKHSGEIPIVRKHFSFGSDDKIIEVFCKDITSFPEDIDILTVSSYIRNYVPTARSVIGSLQTKKRISVKELAGEPFMDLRDSAGCWLSHTIENNNAIDGSGQISRIGCVEINRDINDNGQPGGKLRSLTTYFQMLDIAATAGVKMDTIALPLLGAGEQNIDKNLVVIPLINEAISFLKRNSSAKRIVFIQRNYEKAYFLATAITNSYQLKGMKEPSATEQAPTSGKEPYVFISYSSNGDTESAKMLYQALEARGIDCWFSPEDISSGSYGGQIVEAIQRATHFICLISQNSMKSQHVLNELDLAFQRLSEGIEIIPFRLDPPSSHYTPEFQYYLSRIQWHNGTSPLTEECINEFIDKHFPNS